MTIYISDLVIRIAVFIVWVSGAYLFLTVRTFNDKLRDERRLVILTKAAIWPFFWAKAIVRYLWERE